MNKLSRNYKPRTDFYTKRSVIGRPRIIVLDDSHAVTIQVYDSFLQISHQQEKKCGPISIQFEAIIDKPYLTILEMLGFHVKIKLTGNQLEVKSIRYNTK